VKEIEMSERSVSGTGPEPARRGHGGNRAKKPPRAGARKRAKGGKRAAPRGAKRRKVSGAVAEIRDMLLERRERITREVAEKYRQARGAPLATGDSSDRAATAADGDLALHLAARDAAELATINGALRKIREDTYGRCESCGKRIPAERLKIRPFSSYCVPCKNKMEREEGAPPAGRAAGGVLSGDEEEGE